MAQQPPVQMQPPECGTTTTGEVVTSVGEPSRENSSYTVESYTHFLYTTKNYEFPSLQSIYFLRPLYAIAVTSSKESFLTYHCRYSENQIAVSREAVIGERRATNNAQEHATVHSLRTRISSTYVEANSRPPATSPMSHVLQAYNQ